MTFLFKKISDHEITALSSMIGGLSMDNGPWIAGGCARRLWYGLQWKDADVDVFFPDQETFTRSTSLLDEHHVKAKIIHADGYSVSEKATMPHSTENAKTYQVQIGKVYPNIATIQAICKQWHASALDVIRGFDLTACKFITDGHVVAAMPIAIADCESSILRQDPESDALPAANRVIKYSIYGFEPTREIMLNLLNSHRSGTLSNEVQTNDY